MKKMENIYIHIRKNFLFVFGFIFLCVMTASQTYTLIGKYEEYQKEIIKNQESLLNEIDKSRSADTFYIYYDVSSTQDNFEIERDISLISDSEVFEVIDAVWTDILRCDLFDGNGYQYFSVSETKDYNLEIGRKLSPWRYGGDVPKQFAECYIDGTVSITTELGNIKKLPIESNKFTIGAD